MCLVYMLAGAKVSWMFTLCLLSVLQRSGCSNRAQRRLSSQKGHVDSDWSHDIGGANRTKGESLSPERNWLIGSEQQIPQLSCATVPAAPEMSVCVRSGDCASGLCCVRYLTGKRCQRVPVEGEVCLLRGSKKLRRNLGRCDCGAGLSCSATGQMELSRVKGQGVCTPRRRQVQRKTRHSGKKRQTAERSC